MAEDLCLIHVRSIICHFCWCIRWVATGTAVVQSIDLWAMQGWNW